MVNILSNGIIVAGIPVPLGWISPLSQTRPAVTNGHISRGFDSMASCDSRALPILLCCAILFNPTQTVKMHIWEKSSWFHPFKILVNSACCTSVFPRVFFLLSHILRQIWLKSIVQFPMSIHLKISPKTKTHSWSNRLNDFLKVASLIRVALETLFCGKSSWGMEQEDRLWCAFSNSYQLFWTFASIAIFLRNI